MGSKEYIPMYFISLILFDMSMEAQNYQEDRPEDIIAETKAELNNLSEEVVVEQEKKVENQNYLTKILNTIPEFTERVPKIPYGIKDGKRVPDGLVCDEFVKKVLKKNNTNIDSIGGTVAMFEAIKPNKKLVSSGNKITKIPPIWSLLFRVDGKSCGHVGFFMGMKDGKPQIADASNSWVSQRQLRPEELSRTYYEENYREKFLEIIKNKEIKKSKNQKS